MVTCPCTGVFGRFRGQGRLEAVAVDAVQRQKQYSGTSLIRNERLPGEEFLNFSRNEQAFWKVCQFFKK